jgi:ABC-type transporter Mla MlaB component
MIAACASGSDALEVDLRADGPDGLVICRGALVEGGDLSRVRVAAGRHIAAGRRLVFDLGDVERIDAGGVGAIAAAARDALRHGCRSAVVRARGRVRALLLMSGLAPFVDGLSSP